MPPPLLKVFSLGRTFTELMIAKDPEVLSPEPPSKKTRAKRRRDTAAAGGTFLSRSDLAPRWGCVMQTVITRVKEGNIPEYVFNDKSVRYKLADIEAYESQALARGFQKRAEQLKAIN